MIANFHIHYSTQWGEQIAIRIRRKGGEEVLLCQTYDGDHWQAALQLSEGETIGYKYQVQAGGKSTPEFGEDRQLTAPKGQSQLFVQDFWRPGHEPERVFFTAAFRDVVFRRQTAAAAPKAAVSKKTTKNRVVFQLNAAAIPQHLTVCLFGSSPELGNWKTPLLLDDANFPVWQAAVDVEAPGIDIEYKYALYDPQRRQVVEWETGENRRWVFTFPSASGNTVMRTDELFRRTEDRWQGAGVAIPVFSLRSENGLGIGEFNDLKLMVDWAVKTGLKVVQTLPVNDTIVTKTWKDSYPYRAISVFALHPLYINVESVAKLKDKKAQARLRQLTAELNALDAIDFERVMEAKMEFFRLLFQQEKAAFQKDKEARQFIEANAKWLHHYAAFCHLRDLNGTADFNQWKKYATYSPRVIADLSDLKSEAYDEMQFYYFLQYHAHRQLSGATEYARLHGVVLKGDLPIGIARHSCDAWVAPHLFNMDGQAGAPPDFYAEDGQNWGFPTYNWQVMAGDDFEWWRHRMTKLAEYFDALRIDHILGFFRIWEIPTDQVVGTMGMFNPRLPYSRAELAAFGLHGSLERYTRPYIRHHVLGEIFGAEADFVRSYFLDETAPGVFSLREFVNTQLKIREVFDHDKNLTGKKHLAKGLMKLVAEVLLLEEPGSQGMAFNPRITLTVTRSWKALDAREQQIFERLYNDYYFNRHDEFWRQQALWKLPALLDATNMLICGEDLGMIPASVAGVMKDLNILTLEIQRMPKGNATFGDPEQYPYMSVCSPSCHDMSTVRGWWQEDHERSQQFFSRFIDPYRPAPYECTTGVVVFINRQHFTSPSMWAIFPLQDLVGMDEELRLPVAEAERINEPSDPDHYWRYRFHLPLEQLMDAGKLNNLVRIMVKESGR